MTFPPPETTQERRQAQFDAAETAHQVAELQRQWADEDRAARSADDARAREMLMLRREVADLRRQLERGPDKHFLKTLAEAIAQVYMPELESVAERVGALEQRSLTYGGTWDETRSYDRNVLVTDKGSLWLAVVDTSGERPARSTAWRLVAKSGSTPREQRVALA